jgi:hypothetical protein
LKFGRGRKNITLRRGRSRRRKTSNSEFTEIGTQTAEQEKK